MSGVKGKSGRKPGIKNITQYLYKEIDNNWQELVDALLEKATNGDREALFYCFDRRIGKVKTDIVIDGAGDIGAGVVIELLKAIAKEKSPYIEPLALEQPTVEVATLKEAQDELYDQA